MDSVAAPLRTSELDLDFAVLLRLAEAIGARDIIGVLDLILDSVPQMYRDLRTAVAGGNRHGVGFIAHQLRSECAHVGAARLVSRLARLEEDAPTRALAQLALEVDGIAPQVEHFLDLLEGVRKAHLH